MRNPGTGSPSLMIPDAGVPANYSHFYPGFARLERKGPLSIVVGTPSKKVFAFDLIDGKTLRVRKGFPVDLPAEARGVAALDIDRDGRDELFLTLHDGAVWGLTPDGALLDGFPLRTKADTYAAPLLEGLEDEEQRDHPEAYHHDKGSREAPEAKPQQDRKCYAKPQ